MVGAERSKFDLFRSLEIAISDFPSNILKVLSLHQTGDCESRSMVKCARKTF